MRIKSFLAAVGVLLVTLAVTGPARAQMIPPTASGLWQQVDDKTGEVQGWFLISENNGVFEGIIARMFLRPGDSPNPVCTRCEGDQHNAPWLGLKLITDMRRNGLNYEDGHILDPRDGTVYRALMRLSPDGQTLTVRGYLGIEMLGRDQIWQRLPDSAYAELDPSINPQRPAAAPTTRGRKNSSARTQGGTPKLH